MSSWSARLVKPVTPAKGKPIFTLADARTYILALPELEQQTQRVQDCTQAILMAAEGRGPMFTAQAAVALLVNGPIQLLKRETRDRPWMKRKSA